MRIAVGSRYRHIAGGTEVYLRSVLPVLKEAGCTLLLVHETRQPEGSEPIVDPGEGSIEVVEFGPAGKPGLDAIRRFRPDVIFSQGLDSVALLDSLCSEWPVVHFAHDYQGLCISGKLAWKRPETFCSRALGPGCLAHYLPNGCGGSNPFTMLSLYREQIKRRDVYRKMARIITNSRFVRDRLIRNGVSPERLIVGGLCLPQRDGSSIQPGSRPDSGPWRILFLGRMVREKGGHHLIVAASQAAQRLGTRLEVTFAGEGDARDSWQRLAAQKRSALVDFEFAGWRSAAQCEDLFAATHALVMPSVWPEPLGLTGIEATSRGIPVAAYAAGGIPEWLIDGINGHVAAGVRPNPRALAGAIVSILENGDHYRRLSAGGIEGGRPDLMKNHAAILTDAFDDAASGRFSAG